MKKARSGMIVAALALTSTAFALPSFTPVFNSTYGVKRDGTLSKAGCAICHIGKSPKLNPYGTDLKDAMVSEKATTLTGSVLKRVEDKDSDKDGKKNVDEIRADKNPGDASSK